ncbi:uncharacterized protein [Amphiura filiformis]|uniref:uncharacterized protein n=1 Tax=Amphiura filiformis TaxID=82378 RepID=UPI003B21843C
MAGPNILTIGVALVLVCLVSAGQENEIDKGQPVGGDIHGGVQMGISDPKCDDGQNNIMIDYSKNAMRRVCRCMDPDFKNKVNNRRKNFNKLQVQFRGQRKKQARNGPSTDKPEPPAIEECEPHTQAPLHKCLHEKIKYDSVLPTSGAHRPLWPKFGEYVYLPPQRWIHSLEHGAIVFLYSPCADDTQVNELRTIAHHCLNKHIITPYENLPQGYLFAVLSWGCKLLLPSFDKGKIKDFMIRKALQAPESDVEKEGQYEYGLLHGMELDEYEVTGDPVCPTEPKSTPPPPEDSATQRGQCMMMGDAAKDAKPLSRPTGDKGRDRRPQRGKERNKQRKEKLGRNKDDRKQRFLEDMAKAKQKRGDKKRYRKERRN